MHELDYLLSPLNPWKVIYIFFTASAIWGMFYKHVDDLTGHVQSFMFLMLQTYINLFIYFWQFAYLHYEVVLQKGLKTIRWHYSNKGRVFDKIYVGLGPLTDKRKNFSNII